MPKMLRHTSTGEIWPYNADLSRHQDVEVFDQPDPQFAAAADDSLTIGDLATAEKQQPEPGKAKPKEKAKRKPKSAVAAAEPAPEPTPETEEDEDPLDGLDLPDDV